MTQRLRAILTARRWRENNPDRQAQLNRNYYAANREILKARNLRNQAAHPERSVRYWHERLARKQQGTDHFTEKQWLELKAFYGNRCLGCGRNEEQLLSEGLKLVPDHVKALINGGSDSIDNIQPLCNGNDGCNNHKGQQYIDYRVKGVLTT